MKKTLAEELRSYANILNEGTWDMPTKGDIKRLKQILANPLPVGEEAENAVDALAGIIGDDVLFDRLTDLAYDDPTADAREEIEDWLWEYADDIAERVFGRQD